MLQSSSELHLTATRLFTPRPLSEDVDFTLPSLVSEPLLVKHQASVAVIVYAIVDQITISSAGYRRRRKVMSHGRAGL
jgi:hypothetical protein